MLHRIPIAVNDPWENYNPYTHSSRKEHHHSASASKPRSAEPVTLEQIKKNAGEAAKKSGSSVSSA